MQLNSLKPKTKMRRGQRIGRGGKRGTTAGRGTKGQKARAGHKIRPQIREIIKRMPKLRGHKFHSFQARSVPVSLEALEKNFEKGASITVADLLRKGIVAKEQGSSPRVKILGSGTLSKSFSIVGIAVSKGAKHAIEQAGGSVR